MQPGRMIFRYNLDKAASHELGLVSSEGRPQPSLEAE
jgi:hypothetical protein